MLDTNRFGSIVVSSSSRVHDTALAGSAPTFFVMKTRPVDVPAQADDESALVRSTAATLPPARSPQKAAVSRLGPSSAQSPHWTAKSPVHELQCCCASAIVIVPRPWVFVRYAVRPVPANIQPLSTGSLMIGE